MPKKGLYMYCNQNVYSSNPTQKTVRWFQVGNDFNTKKEVKKVNKIPYFELKVVKVKKEKNKCEHPFRTWESGLFYPKFKCTKCGEFVIPPFKMEEGNWVNGENLDKIKFPCFCSFLVDGKERVYGELDDCVNYNRQIICIKELVQQVGQLYIRMNRQRYYFEFPICDLGSIVKTKDIHILQGKITIFEEEE